MILDSGMVCKSELSVALIKCSFSSSFNVRVVFLLVIAIVGFNGSVPE